MFYDRKALKRNTKALIRQGNPPIWQLTLIYLLATTWVSWVLNFLIPNPLDKVADVANDWMQTLYGASYVSQGAIDAMYQQMFAALTGPMAMIGLLVSLLVTFYSMVVGVGYCAVTLKMMRGGQPGTGDLFSFFYLAGKIVLLGILEFIFIYLWSLLFIIPGIVAAYRYRLAEFCLIDDPDISALEAIRRSKALMRGRKGELFVTDLSFLGWGILGSLISQGLFTVFEGFSSTLGDVVSLAATTAFNLFLLTYQSLTVAGFYLFVLGNQAPPVNNPGNFDRFDPPQNFGGDEGWNQ